MAYEVFIDVIHHPKHGDDSERRASDCMKYADLPDGTDELVYVVTALREMADDIDPRVTCTHCGKVRGEHHREGPVACLYRCFGSTGPITQSSWWGPPVTDSPWADQEGSQDG